MNERIKELAAQAGFAVWGDAVFMHDPKVNDDNVVENFAELIIKECCSQVREIDAMEINKHFGINGG